MMNENEDVYGLDRRQAGLFARFKAMGEKNKKEMISKAVGFIRHELRFNPETGKSLPAVIGISGGIDSAVVAALAARAVRKENIILVEMPYEGLSARIDIEYADLLAERLGIENVSLIPINEMVDAEVATLGKAGIVLGAFERGNVMARMRMVTLYAIANQCGGRVLDTCNLTEVMMGYFTKFGDGASDLNPVGEIHKTWMWIIGRELGIPEVIIRRKPTAGLMGSAQTDEKDMGISYSALDLMLWLRRSGVGDRELVSDYHYPRAVVERVSATIARNSHKNRMAKVCELDL